MRAFVPQADISTETLKRNSRRQLHAFYMLCECPVKPSSPGRLEAIEGVHIPIVGKSLNRAWSASDGTKRASAPKPRAGAWGSDQGERAKNARTTLNCHSERVRYMMPRRDERGISPQYIR